MAGIAWALWAILGTQVAVAKALSEERGSLTILMQNDLENNPPPGSGAILIEQAKTYHAAVEACGQLSESLWSNANNISYASLKASLAYQVYQGNHAADAKFWIERETDGCECRAVGADGSLHYVKCSIPLPVLCSQSAPVSNASFEDTSPRYQITQQVGDSQMTGYRDFFAWKFRGIRYAPTPKRFEYSTTLRNASGPISALKAGADCLQPNSIDSSDDCLFLNIWTPYLPSKMPSKTALKPVLFYIYGGNFVDGSGKNPYLDMTNMASRGDVVAVSINHRAGNFGMMVFNDGVHTGNLALNDQISALTWVAENIAAFGGDPDRVTIAGESSGAVSVRHLMSSPKAQGLYAGALLQSDGNGGLLQPFGILWSMEQSYNFFTKTVLNLVGCQDAEDEVACLRSVPGQQLANLDLDTAISKYLVLDGKFLVTPTFPLDGSGPRYAKDIPLLAGVTRDEAGLFSFLHQIPWPAINFDYWKIILNENQAFFRVDPNAILNNLPLFGISPESTGEELYNATVSILTLNMYTCLDRAQTYSGAKNHVFEKVYFFNFHRTYSPPPNNTPYCSAPPTAEHPFGDPTAEYYRCHGGSQVTMFGNYKRVGLPDRDGLDQDFSQLIVDYFSSFVRTGDPNMDDAYLIARGYDSTLVQLHEVGKWDKVNPEKPEWMILEWDGFMAPFGDSEKCSVLGQPLNYWEEPMP
ncbi:camp-regulated D2 protein [Stachybotrys elegans]|uniref:Carboxylic ester hydrolase n=1 Tax=Stachybotrys elegans TaxID=80388 RepID=A0A8K0STQ9_9HYPO|nr:camp-regulated D2 protein [Stachybotrys elegans]